MKPEKWFVVLTPSGWPISDSARLMRRGSVKSFCENYSPYDNRKTWAEFRKEGFRCVKIEVRLIEKEQNK